MKAIIFSHEGSGSYVMDREGSFRFVRGYSSLPVGSEIELKRKAPVQINRIAAIAACFMVMAAIGLFAMLLNTVNYYAYVDINPSVELAFNKLGRLKTATPLNEDGAQLCSELKLRGRLDDTVIALIEAADKMGFIVVREGVPAVLITIYSDNAKLRQDNLAMLNAALREHGMLELTMLESCAKDTRQRAEGLGESPGKLILAERLISISAEPATLEEVLHMTVAELFEALHDAQGSAVSIPPVPEPGGAFIGIGAPPETPTDPEDDDDEDPPTGDFTPGGGQIPDPDPPPENTPPTGDKPKPPPAPKNSSTVEIELPGGETVTVTLTGTGNNRKLEITITDDYGTYSEIFPYVNGSKEGTYIIEGERGIYTIYVVFKGNAVLTVELADYEETYDPGLPDDEPDDPDDPDDDPDDPGGP